MNKKFYDLSDQIDAAMKNADLLAYELSEDPEQEKVYEMLAAAFELLNQAQNKVREARMAQQ